MHRSIRFPLRDCIDYTCECAEIHSIDAENGQSFDCPQPIAIDRYFSATKDRQAQRSAFFILNAYVHEGRNTDDFDGFVRQKRVCNRYRLDGLARCTGPDGVDFGVQCKHNQRDSEGPEKDMQYEKSAYLLSTML